jgi:hypothetical protein
MLSPLALTQACVMALISDCARSAIRRLAARSLVMESLLLFAASFLANIRSYVNWGMYVNA